MERKIVLRCSTHALNHKKRWKHALKFCLNLQFYIGKEKWRKKCTIVHIQTCRMQQIKYYFTQFYSILNPSYHGFQIFNIFISLFHILDLLKYL